jgi:hypothetical protein
MNGIADVQVSHSDARTGARLRLYALGVYPAVCAIAKRSGFREVKNTEKPTQTLQELWDHIEKIYLPKRKSC